MVLLSFLSIALKSVERRCNLQYTAFYSPNNTFHIQYIQGQILVIANASPELEKLLLSSYYYLQFIQFKVIVMAVC